jgi:hypothetical protein
MATNDERHAAHLLTLLQQAPGQQLSSEQLAEQTGWSPEELSAAVGLLRGRQQVVLDDAALGSGHTIASRRFGCRRRPPRTTLRTPPPQSFMTAVPHKHGHDLPGLRRFW